MVGKKLQLISAPLSPRLVPSIRAGAYPPLHLVSLSSYVSREMPDCEIEILDGEILDLETILTRLKGDADWIGISANTLTYETAIQIAEAAHELGPRIVLGGAHAQFAAQEILSNRIVIDAVVIGDGEEALLRLLRGDPFGIIPNLAYRVGKQIVVPQETRVPFDILPYPDYGLVPVEKYFRRYRHLYPEKPFHGAFTVFSAKGCQWRDKTGGGCVFCSIQHLGFRMKTPRTVWDEISRLNTDYGADFFWDVSDTFTMQREWVAAFSATRPWGLEVGFHLYGRPSDIDPAMADHLRDIGTYEVFLGLESGSNAALKAAFKGVSMRQNIRAVQLLNDRGIRVVVSIILGLPGETRDSLLATCDMCHSLVATADISEMHCSILLPLPGSRVFRTMLELPDLYRRFGGKDCLDLEALRADWVNRFCNVPYEVLLEAQTTLLNVGPRVGSFGRALKPYISSTELPITMSL